MVDTSVAFCAEASSFRIFVLTSTVAEPALTEGYVTNTPPPAGVLA
jgi:hypothetical protein